MKPYFFTISLCVALSTWAHAAEEHNTGTLIGRAEVFDLEQFLLEQTGQAAAGHDGQAGAAQPLQPRTRKELMALSLQALMENPPAKPTCLEVECQTQHRGGTYPNTEGLEWHLKEPEFQAPERNPIPQIKVECPHCNQTVFYYYKSLAVAHAIACKQFGAANS